jgi:uncharacterized membrane protein YhhN
MKKYLLQSLFFLIVVGDLVGEWFQNKLIDYSFKPLIMVWIAAYFFLHAKNIDKRVKIFAGIAFLFSWMGDIFLMFSDKGFLFFIFGLGAFFIAQIVYINLFLRTINLSGNTPYLKKNPFWLIAYIFYGMVIYMLLYNHLDPVLKFAVFAYMIALLGMSAMALNRFGNGHPISFSFVFAGSILFVLSDSMIAINKFLTPIPYEGILIMSTYIGAQYFIMKGLIKQYE